MAKYLLLGRYTQDGAKGLLKEKATARVEAAVAAIESVGGKLEAHYLTAGRHSFVLIVDLPESASLVTISTAGLAAGTIDEGDLYPLFDAAEVDAALAKGFTYRTAQ